MQELSEGSECWNNPSREKEGCKKEGCKKEGCKKERCKKKERKWVMESEKMMKIVSEFEELNKAVRAPNDANGCTARSVHVAEDGRMTLTPLVKIRERRINRISSGTMRRRK